MKKICALFCSLGVLTGVNNRYSKSCKKCSQNLISYQRAYREGKSFVGFVSRLSWGIFKTFIGTLSFFGSNDIACRIKIPENNQEAFKNTLRVVSLLVGADGFRDIMDTLNLSEERADFELLKEIYDKNYKGKSDVILDNFKENGICATYDAIRLLEVFIEFAAYWNAYCNKVIMEILDIFSSKANSLGLDKETMTVNGILEVLEPGAIKKIVNDIVIISKKVDSNIDCIMKLKNDYLKGELTFEDANSKFVEIQSNQQKLEEKLKEQLKNLRYSVDKI